MNGDCKFCQEFTGNLPTNRMPAPIGDRIIAHFGDCMLLPTLGCVADGYSLLMPLRHAVSFAWWQTTNGHVQPGAIVNAARGLVESVYGPCIVAEHGAGSACDRGVACCDHAHLHIIPVPNDGDSVVTAYVERGGIPKALPSFEALAEFAGQSYLYLSPGAGEHLIWPARGFACQFVRRVVASVHGLPEEWDWRAFPHADRMITTLETLRAIANGTSEQMVA